jgi:hypothetical protein
MVPIVAKYTVFLSTEKIVTKSSISEGGSFNGLTVKIQTILNVAITKDIGPNVSIVIISAFPIAKMFLY